MISAKNSWIIIKDKSTVVHRPILKIFIDASSLMVVLACRYLMEGVCQPKGHFYLRAEELVDM